MEIDFNLPGPLAAQVSASAKVRNAMEAFTRQMTERIAAAKEEGIKLGLEADDTKAKQLALHMAVDNERLRSKVILLEQGCSTAPDEDMLRAWMNELHELFGTDADPIAVERVLLGAYRWGYGCRTQELNELQEGRLTIAELRQQVAALSEAAGVDVSGEEEE